MANCYDRDALLAMYKPVPIPEWLIDSESDLISTESLAPALAAGWQPLDSGLAMDKKSYKGSRSGRGKRANSKHKEKPTAPMRRQVTAPAQPASHPAPAAHPKQPAGGFEFGDDEDLWDMPTDLTDIRPLNDVIRRDLEPAKPKAPSHGLERAKPVQAPAPAPVPAAPVEDEIVQPPAPAPKAVSSSASMWEYLDPKNNLQTNHPLQKMIRWRGHFKDDTRVRRVGDTTWRMITDYPELNQGRRPPQPQPRQQQQPLLQPQQQPQPGPHMFPGQPGMGPMVFPQMMPGPGPQRSGPPTPTRPGPGRQSVGVLLNNAVAARPGQYPMYPVPYQPGPGQAPGKHPHGMPTHGMFPGMPEHGMPQNMFGVGHMPNPNPNPQGQAPNGPNAQPQPQSQQAPAPMPAPWGRHPQQAAPVHHVESLMSEERARQPERPPAAAGPTRTGWGAQPKPKARMTLKELFMEEQQKKEHDRTTQARPAPVMTMGAGPSGAPPSIEDIRRLEQQGGPHFGSPLQWGKK